jgi:hypothetical protein
MRMDVSIQKDTDAAGHQISKVTPGKGSASLWVDELNEVPKANGSGG